MKKQLFEKVYVEPQDKVPFWEQVAYGVGGLIDGGGVAMISCILLKYMTDTLMIVAAAASTIMMLAKIWDAVTDPLMGFISDNTRSRFGRRKPYMFMGGIAIFIALTLLFAPLHTMGITSQGGMFAWMLVFYLFYSTCTTLSQVPYTSMASDISHSYHERNNANTVKLVFTSVASGLGYLVPLLLLNALQEKHSITPVKFWLLTAVIFGALFGGGLIICAIFVKERVHPAPHEKKQKFSLKKFVEGYIKPYKNKSYTWHIGMYVAAFTCMDMLSALATYYASHVWRGSILDLGFMQMKFSSLFIIAPMAVAAVLAFPLVRIMMDKKGKGFAFRMGLPFYIIGGILFAVLDPRWCPAWVVPLVAFIMGFGFGGAQMIPWMNFPDTLDVAELKLGEHPTGTYSGMMTFARKLSGALGVGVIGWILTGIGYDSYNAAIKGAESLAAEEGSVIATEYANTTANNIGEFLRNFADQINARVQQLSADGQLSINVSGFDAAAIGDNISVVLTTIRVLMGVSVAVLISIAMFCSFKFKLNNKILARMRYFNDKIKQGEYDSLTDEEKQERIKLITTHYGKYDADQDAQMIAEKKALWESLTDEEKRKELGEAQ
ncbi:MAG: MFS transporter [Clostridia bacterium]|nr:MFS transporter [Clostridia bacterium]